MAVRKLIVKKDKPNVEELISKGAPVIKDKSRKKKFVNINLRITTDLLDQIDEQHKLREGISRTGWLIETISLRIKSLKNQKKNENS